MLTTAQYTAIKTEVVNGSQYQTAYNANDVASLCSIYNSVLQVGTADLIGVNDYLMTHMAASTDPAPAFWMIKGAASGTTQPQATLAGMILDLLSSRAQTLDMTNATVIGLLSKVVSAGLLSAQNQTDITALATSQRNVSATDMAFALYNTNGSKK